MTKGIMAVLPAVLLLALPTVAAADAFSGIGLGIYAHSSNVEADSTFNNTASDTNDDDNAGLGFKLSYRSPGDGFGYSFDARLQGFGAEIDLYGDSRLDVNHLVSVGTGLGYVTGRHFFHGIVELGTANVEYAVDGYRKESDNLLTFGLGLGYILRIDDNIELNAEIIGRRFQDYEAEFVGGDLHGTWEEIEITAGTVSLGMNYRF